MRKNKFKLADRVIIINANYNKEGQTNEDREHYVGKTYMIDEIVIQDNEVRYGLKDENNFYWFEDSLKDVNEVTLIFMYKNWKGETGVREVCPINMWYGHTDFHKEDQWLLKALDIEKNAERDFAMNDIIRFIKEGEE